MAAQIAKIQVALGERSYEIEIGPDHRLSIGCFLASRIRVTHAVLITDSNVVQPYADAVAQCLVQAGVRTDTLIVPAGEGSKTIECATQLWNEMLRCRTDRKSVVIALGGGVVGDLAGFVAAAFARGLPLIQVPTTLLAQVDSSVGGKVGVNLPHAKNVVGAFWQPRGVLIDTSTLATLPIREFRAGLAEVIKYGVILDADFFTYIESHIPEILRREADIMRHIISRCCQLKAEVVQQDEREESGMRAVLNYGHTFGHAIETVTGYIQYLHGEAVSIGMVCAAALASLMDRVDADFCQRQRTLLSAFGLPVQLGSLDNDALIAAMQRDKKVEHGKLRFVLPTRFGNVELVDNVDLLLVRRSLDLARE